MVQIAVYPGTFDPITQGHVDIITRATRMFDKVIVAVASTSRKLPYLSLEERLALLTEVLGHLASVRVARLEGLLIDFVKQHHAEVIVRGLRTVSDFDYEFQLAHMNQRLLPGIETIFLPASEESTYISATIVREIMDLGGDVSRFVPARVARYLIEKKKK